MMVTKCIECWLEYLLRNRCYCQKHLQLENGTYPERCLLSVRIIRCLAVHKGSIRHGQKWCGRTPATAEIIIDQHVNTGLLHNIDKILVCEVWTISRKLGRHWAFVMRSIYYGGITLLYGFWASRDYGIKVLIVFANNHSSINWQIIINAAISGHQHK